MEFLSKTTSEKKKEKIKVREMTLMAMLTALALIIFTVESWVPPLVAIPGVKLGLANVITLVAIFTLGKRKAFCILIMRIVLGSIFTGQMMALAYSLAGGLLCYGVTCLMSSFTHQQIWIAGVIGAIMHNIGQIIMAVVITKTVGVVMYLPILLITGMITGLFTGLVAQMVVPYIATSLLRKKY